MGSERHVWGQCELKHCGIVYRKQYNAHIWDLKLYEAAAVNCIQN